MFFTVVHIFCHAFTSTMILWQNQDSHTCVVVEVFHENTQIIIMEVSTSMMINRASQKCFRQGWTTRGIHRNGTPLSYRVRFWIWSPVNSPDQWGFSTCKLLIGRREHLSAHQWARCRPSIGGDMPMIHRHVAGPNRGPYRLKRPAQSKAHST